MKYILSVLPLNLCKLVSDSAIWSESQLYTYPKSQYKRNCLYLTLHIYTLHNNRVCQRKNKKYHSMVLISSQHVTKTDTAAPICRAAFVDKRTHFYLSVKILHISILFYLKCRNDWLVYCSEVWLHDGTKTLLILSFKMTDLECA